MTNKGKRCVIPRAGRARDAGNLLAPSRWMFCRLKLPLSLTELLKRTVNETIADDVLNLAAQQAYYFFFALFPALLTFIAEIKRPYFIITFN